MRSVRSFSSSSASESSSIRNYFSSLMIFDLTSSSMLRMPCSSFGRLSINTVSSCSSPSRLASTTSVRWRRLSILCFICWFFFRRASSSGSYMFSGSSSSSGASSESSSSTTPSSAYSESPTFLLPRRPIYGAKSLKASSISSSSLAYSISMFGSAFVFDIANTAAQKN